MPVEFTSHKDAILQELDRKFQMANEIIGGMAEGYAKAYAPKDTGNLMRSITHAAEDNYRKVVIGTNVQYAPYQELGAPNAHVPAHPFLRPALENHIGEYKNVLERILRG